MPNRANCIRNGSCRVVSGGIIPEYKMSGWILYGIPNRCGFWGVPVFVGIRYANPRLYPIKKRVNKITKTLSLCLLRKRRSFRGLHMTIFHPEEAVPSWIHILSHPFLWIRQHKKISKIFSSFCVVSWPPWPVSFSSERSVCHRNGVP